ncbi:MAG: M48 family metallopeptidase [Verrucomicrobiae bacterium]|nr:M48 family metallopeptidase [Verrucomicrobiae bacterium]
MNNVFSLTFSLVLAISANLLLVGCQSVPVTGRKQIILMSSSEEMQLGLSSFEALKKETPVSKNVNARALIERVGRRIAAVADLPGAQWEFVLFESAEANAFCLPGGKVGIYTGILPITKDEAGLATVIGHEVAHAVARHGAERMSESRLIGFGGQLLGTGVQSYDPKTQALIMAAYGLGSKVGRELPHSRGQESEADRIGLIYMARAGYDPAAAVDFWRRFQAHNQSQGASTPWFLRTHPLDETRIRQIQAWLPEARAQSRPR